MRTFILATLLLSASFLCAEDGGAPAPGSPAALKERADLQDAFAWIAGHGTDTQKEWIRLTEMEAPSKEEAARGDYMLKRFRDLGLADVQRDGMGNVWGILKGARPAGKWIVVDAHMDTVTRPGQTVTVEQRDGRLHGAGIGDDTSGLAALLAALEALRAAKVRLQEDVVFLATVQEEIGLIGARYFIETHAERIGMYVSVDGGYKGVTYGATEIHWYKFHFKAPGAHTLSSYGSPSSLHALAKTIADLYDLPLAREPEAEKTWLNIGMVGGGDVPNAQCRDCWFTLDLRSNNPENVKRLAAQAQDIAAKNAALVGVTFEREIMEQLPGASLPGHKDSRLVQTALATLRALGVENPPASVLGSANHNQALLHGIPGINIGAADCSGTHTPTESCDPASLATGTKQILLLTCSLAGMD